MESRSRLSQFSPQRDDFAVNFASSLPREFQRHYVSREQVSKKLTSMRQTLTPSSRRISVLKKVSPNSQEFSGFTFVNLPYDKVKSEKTSHTKTSSISSLYKTSQLRWRDATPQQEIISKSDSKSSLDPSLLRRGSSELIPNLLDYSFRNFDEELKIVLPEPPIVTPPSTRRPHKLKRSQINSSSLYLSPTQRQEKLNQPKTPTLNILSYGDSLSLSKGERAANFVDLFQNYLRKLKNERGKSTQLKERAKAKTSVLNSPFNNSLESTAVHSHNISMSEILLTNSSEGCCSPRDKSESKLKTPKTPSVTMERASLPQKLRNQAQSQRARQSRANFFYAYKRTDSNLKPPKIKVTLKNGAYQGTKFGQTPRFGRSAITISPPQCTTLKRELVAVGSRVDLDYAKENGSRKHRTFILALEQSMKLKQQCRVYDLQPPKIPSLRANLHQKSSSESSIQSSDQENSEDDESEEEEQNLTSKVTGF